MLTPQGKYTKMTPYEELVRCANYDGKFRDRHPEESLKRFASRLWGDAYDAPQSMWGAMSEKTKVMYNRLAADPSGNLYRQVLPEIGCPLTEEDKALLARADLEEDEEKEDAYEDEEETTS